MKVITEMGRWWSNIIRSGPTASKKMTKKLWFRFGAGTGTVQK
jgi:hypothetical protein